MQKLFFVLSIVIAVLLFQSCGNVNLNSAQNQSLNNGLPGEPVPDPAAAPPVAAPAFVPYKMMFAGVSQCADSANNTCRTGMIRVDLASGTTQYFDLGAQASGNQPFFAKVYEQGDILRFAVSQQIAVQITPSQFSGTIWLVEYDRKTSQFKKILEENKLEYGFGFFVSAWSDCNGDGVKDWIHYSGVTYPYQILCRSSVNGAVLKSLYSGGDLPRIRIKDVDGDGLMDIMSEGSAGKVSIFGSKTMASGVAPLVTWNLPSGNTAMHYFPENFDADGDGWNDMVDIPADNYNRSVFIHSGKTGLLLKEIISPTGEKYLYPRGGRFLAGTSVQLLFAVIAPVSAGGGNVLEKSLVINSDGSVAGQFVKQDFFDSFASLGTKPACWQGCMNPAFNIVSSLADLDGDGFADFISNSFALYSLKTKTGFLYIQTPQYYFWNPYEHPYLE